VGVIDALSEGFNLISRKVWIILLPVLLDLALWLGPRLSVVPLLQSPADLTDLPPDLAQMMTSLTEVQKSAAAIAQHINLFSLLALFAPQTLGVPSLMAGGLPEAGFIQQVPVIPVRSSGAFYGWTFLLVILGILMGCLYWGLIAQQVREEPADLGHLLRRAGVWWSKLLALNLLLLFLGLMVALPTLLLLGFLAIVSQGLALVMVGLLAAMVMWLGLLLFFYCFFFIAAFVMDDRGVRRALRGSILVVQRNFWSALGLVLLINVISLGLTIIWRALTSNVWGTLLGIVGNAYLGSALIAASLTFYRERGRQVQEASRLVNQ
jgi:hypothetical protein